MVNQTFGKVQHIFLIICD